MRNIFLLLMLIAMGWVGCSSTTSTPPPDNTQPSAVTFVRGADVGWLTEMEAAGVKFFNNDGVQQECMQLLKSKGINSIRLRAWVNPKKGWNNTRDLVVKSLRAKNLGMRLMIDFHYSDDWADPGKQFIPSAWAAMPFNDMKTALYNYTKKVMDTLKTVGITPEWVQVGNETNDGMLWEVGRASKSMANFAGFVKAGYDAVKEVSPASQVIVHLSNGYDNGLYRWMFDGLKSNGAKWDIIGLSLYPTWAPGGVNDWANTNARCLANMNDLVARYNTPVMVVEVGMPADQPGLCNLFLKDIIAKTKSVSNNSGLGVFYWEPQSYAKWQGYGLAAFDDAGRPTVAMDAFLE
jgi:arabinogalactan endo-1,4-beta-galactosidase